MEVNRYFMRWKKDSPDKLREVIKFVKETLIKASHSRSYAPIYVEEELRYHEDNPGMFPYVKRQFGSPSGELKQSLDKILHTASRAIRSITGIPSFSKIWEEANYQFVNGLIPDDNYL
jgi:hypothetical protein